MAYENILNTIETLKLDVETKRVLLNATLSDIANEKNSASIKDLSETQRISDELRREEEIEQQFNNFEPERPQPRLKTIAEMAREARII